jgi:levanase/levanbiose-producing levanase
MTETTTHPAGPAEDAAPNFRPILHYTAKNTWLNDPNGLVWHQGVYHLFYQNNPFDNVWGNMSWGHATSTDLLHWTEHPVAIACDEEEDVFSGSIVVDHGNTSGFGTVEDPALVAIYTSAFKEGSAHQGTQAQSLALSTDAGMTWNKYAGNPVLGRGSAHFRDPKVFRYEGPAGSCWVMVAVEAQHQQVVLYRSANLKDWEYLSTFGPANATGGEWECPDLFPLPVDGDPDSVKWVLVVNVNPGAVAGGSGGQYFVGDFDGVQFTADSDSLVPADADGTTDLRHCLWLDWGRDYYAAVSFSNAPENRRIMIGWMNNWDYANQTPTGPWRSAMSLARELSLAMVGGRPQLIQKPVLPDLAESRGRAFELASAVTVEDSSHPVHSSSHGEALIVRAEFLAGTARRFGLDIRETGPAGEVTGQTTLRYDAAGGELAVDRTGSGNAGFHPLFPSVESCPVTLRDGVLALEIVLDHCSVEVFAQHGESTITDLVFPAPGGRTVCLVADGGDVTLSQLSVVAIG